MNMEKRLWCLIFWRRKRRHSVTYLFWKTRKWRLRWGCIYRCNYLCVSVCVCVWVCAVMLLVNCHSYNQLIAHVLSFNETYLCYIRTQSVPRSKHTPSRLYKPVSLLRNEKPTWCHLLSSDIKLVFHSSTIAMMHGPINIRSMPDV